MAFAEQLLALPGSAKYDVLKLAIIWKRALVSNKRILKFNKFIKCLLYFFLNLLFGFRLRNILLTCAICSKNEQV